MADDSNKTGTSGSGGGGSSTAGANTAVKSIHDHDRVSMLSVKVDGTPDQHEPEFIGDKDAALAATEEQFSQQAVSAADVELRGAQDSGTGTTVEDPKPDPTIKKFEEGHRKADKAARAAAKKAVDALHKD